MSKCYICGAESPKDVPMLYSIMIPRFSENLGGCGVCVCAKCAEKETGVNPER